MPLRDGIVDEQYVALFKAVVDDVVDAFRPEAIVLQCGADGLAGDRLGTVPSSMGKTDERVRVWLAAASPHHQSLFLFEPLYPTHL